MQLNVDVNAVWEVARTAPAVASIQFQPASKKAKYQLYTIELFYDYYESYNVRFLSGGKLISITFIVKDDAGTHMLSDQMNALARGLKAGYEAASVEPEQRSKLPYIA